MNEKQKIVEFNKTTFYKGLNAAFGKIPVKLEICLDFQQEGVSLKLGLFVGIDKMYRINDVERFLKALETLETCHFGKNFIFEPAKMFFERDGRKLLEFLCHLQTRWGRGNLPPFASGEILLDETESESLLDHIWDNTAGIRFCRQPVPLRFENDIDVGITVEKKEGFYFMTVDYSTYGDFEPVTVNFRYIAFKEQRIIVRLPEEKKELFVNLYPFKNKECVVVFRIGGNEKKLFQKNFLEPYGPKLKISIEEDVKKEITQNSLLTRAYFDVSPRGIVSKIEFCYGEKCINPLNDVEAGKSFREFDMEQRVLDELKSFGFREQGRLFLLDEGEKIMNLLTDKLTVLKQLAEVYYSADFKKLYVKHVNSLGLSLSEDESVIHMNINLENISDEELAALLEAINQGKKYYRLRNGSIINLSSVESKKLVELIRSLGISEDNIRHGMFDIPLNRCLYIGQYLKEKGMENVEIEKRLGGLMKSISNPETIEVDLEEPLRKLLRNYQVTGVRWLENMAHHAMGGILADDMGLGKTLQVLAFIAGEKKREQPCMVVAPTSILYNWKAEAEKFVPWLKVLIVTGSKEKRSLLICGCNQADVVITSYGALKNDIEDYRKIRFSYVFVDEAQNIKNPMTLNANSVKSLTAGCCFALTGTPIENRLTELWSIFDFVMPGFLLDRNRFVRTYEEPIIREKNQEKMEELSALIKPFILRRMKREVLTELPEKIETNYICGMTEAQEKLYAAYYKDLKRELGDKIEADGIERSHIEILAALTRLRQICAHPATFVEHYNGGSGKLELAMEVIEEAVGTGHSILVFSQFTKMLKILRNELEKSRVSLYYLDGTMSPEERAMEVENFNSDREAVFLISLKAGGTGLNLTKADIVIHFDPWWNPAVEDQASDRAYRIGQKKVVQVYKLLTEGTIEEKIASLQERKKDLIGNIIKPGENFFNSLSEEEIRGVFGLSVSP